MISSADGQAESDEAGDIHGTEDTQETGGSGDSRGTGAPAAGSPGAAASDHAHTEAASPDERPAAGRSELTRPMVALSAEEPTRIGDYQLLGLLGRGGMGSVYLGRSPAGRQVAVKVVRSDLAADPEFLRLFHREAQLARRVARFCTAEVLDVGEDAGRPFLVTEYVDGPTLWDAVNSGGPFGAAQLERIAIAVATALTAIHGAGMVHRDLKPSNVMLSGAGPLVIDFGIAHALDGTTQLSRTSTGTPAFMAPEQARGEGVGPAADVFAWGGVVVFAATGRPPFGTGRPEVLLYRVVHERPDLSGIPRPLRAVVAAAMRSEAAARPSAQELYNLLLTAATQASPVVVSPLPAVSTDETDVASETDTDIDTDTGTEIDADTTTVGASDSGTDLPAAAPERSIEVDDAAQADETASMAPSDFVAPGVGGPGLSVGSAGVPGPEPSGPGVTPAVPTQRRVRAWKPLSTFGGSLADGSRREIVALGLVGVLVLLGVLLALGEAGGPGSSPRADGAQPSPMVAVPLLTGRAVADAEEALRALGLRPVRAEAVTSDVVAAGQVVAQDPPDGRRVPAGGAVRLTLSSGSAQVEVPDVVGRTEEEAKSALTSAGFVVTASTELSDDRLSGQVIRSVPAHPQRVARGSEVALVVSSGPATVVIPAGLEGQIYGTARQRLKNLGLTVNGTFETSTRVPAGQVIRSRPGAGQRVAVGSTVTLTVSSGAPAPRPRPSDGQSWSW
ncbi:PASTA domain-containing protein [Parafrankia sp. FMc6]|uniref:PASTA domain-containing protein n=1 Tax=Parafrankia soli TaxID=2599596 RepID=UPI0034D7A2B5